jgi:Tol biopolymer transport system component/DNA-binding winged helix-turn-helix (wHTH) protein
VSTNERRAYRFADFQADLTAGELRKAGIRIKIQEQPMRVLAALLERPGELVAREELQHRIWPDVQALDFEHGLNMAVRKLRTALNDSAEAPRYIETTPRKGYRFIGTIQAEAAPAPPADVPARERLPGPRRFVLSVAALAALSIVSAAMLLRRPNEPLRTSVLFSGPGQVGDLAFSPDGKVVAFSVTGPQRVGSRIYLKAPGAAQPRRLTDDTDARHAEAQPHWIPGGWITFLRRDADAPRALYAVPEIGGTPHKLLDLGENQGHGWAPDGKTLAVSKRQPSGRLAIYAMRAADGRMQQLSYPPDTAFSGPGPIPSVPVTGGDVVPAYSPDGSRIAFVRRLPDVKILMVMAAGGGAATEALRSANPLGPFAWDADGRTILCSVTTDEGVASMVRVGLRGGKAEPLNLAGAGAGGGSPAVAGTGDKMAFVVRSERSKIWRYDFDAPSSPRAVVEAEGMQVAPSFAPDSERFAFASSRGGNWQIYATRKEGGFPIQLTSVEHGGAGWPRWSPDGRRIAFDGRPNGQAQIYVVDAEGGTPRRLTEGAGDAVMPEWSQDGSAIYYTRLLSNGTSDIWKVAAAGGVSTRVTSNNAYGVLPSLDGSYLFVGRNAKAGLDAIPLGGGPPYSVEGPANIGRMAIAPGGIYYAGPYTASNVAPVMYYSFATKTTKQLFLTQGRPMGPVLAVSPQEKYALISQVDDYQSRILLVENFR